MEAEWKRANLGSSIPTAQPGALHLQHCIVAVMSKKSLLVRTGGCRVNTTHHGDDVRFTLPSLSFATSSRSPHTPDPNDRAGEKSDENVRVMTEGTNEQRDPR